MHFEESCPTSPHLCAVLAIDRHIQSPETQCVLKEGTGLTAKRKKKNLNEMILDDILLST